MNPLSPSIRGVSSTLMYVLRGACYFFLAFGVLVLSYAGFVLADSHAYQGLEMKKFEQPGRLSEPHILAEGEVIGEIQVPRLGLNAIVVQGDSRASLRHAVGHMPKSALPGEWGNVAWRDIETPFFVRCATFNWGTRSDSRLPSIVSSTWWNPLKLSLPLTFKYWNHRAVTI